MLPLSIDLTRLSLALIGNGAPCLRRLGLLDAAGAPSLTVFSAAPVPELAQAAGDRLRRHWPSRDDLRGTQLVFIADVPEPERSALAATARLAGAILHVEDAPALTDCHAPAVLRRGGLTIAVSTDGAAPGLAAEIRNFLGGLLGPEWQERLEHIKTLRHHWRAVGADHVRVRRLTAARLDRYGWLKHGALRRVANNRGVQPQETNRGGVS
jgi:precorrin-2 dehydrogenase / sirohydrochlorin ferrochelatase